MIKIMETGSPERKDDLSRYVRRIEAGERVVVTAHGQTTQFQRLIASGVITPPVEDGDALEHCPNIRLPKGASSSLIDADRDET